MYNYGLPTFTYVSYRFFFCRSLTFFASAIFSCWNVELHSSIRLFLYEHNYTESNNQTLVQFVTFHPYICQCMSIYMSHIYVTYMFAKVCFTVQRWSAASVAYSVPSVCVEQLNFKIKPKFRNVLFLLKTYPNIHLWSFGADAIYQGEGWTVKITKW